MALGIRIINSWFLLAFILLYVSGAPLTFLVALFLFLLHSSAFSLTPHSVAPHSLAFALLLHLASLTSLRLPCLRLLEI